MTETTQHQAESACVAPTPRKRFRVNMSLDETTYRWLGHVSAVVGIDSTPSGVAASLIRLIRSVAERRLERGRLTEAEESAVDEIASMFTTYAETEAEPWRVYTYTIPT